MVHFFSPLIMASRFFRQLPKVSRSTLILLLCFFHWPRLKFRGFVLDRIEQGVVFLGVM
jgi:hypothetical protein